VYEHRSEPLLSRIDFLKRFARHAGFAAGLVGFSLVAGMVGYVRLARMDWTDAFLNSAMLLGGMGPVGDLPTKSAKIFAGCFALYAGVIFIVAASLIVAPVAHRIFHRLHVDED